MLRKIGFILIAIVLNFIAFIIVSNLMKFQESRFQLRRIRDSIEIGNKIHYYDSLVNYRDSLLIMNKHFETFDCKCNCE